MALLSDLSVDVLSYVAAYLDYASLVRFALLTGNNFLVVKMKHPSCISSLQFDFEYQGLATSCSHLWAPLSFRHLDQSSSLYS